MNNEEKAITHFECHPLDYAKARKTIKTLSEIVNDTEAMKLEIKKSPERRKNHLYIMTAEGIDFVINMKKGTVHGGNYT